MKFSDCKVSSGSIGSEALSLTGIALTQLHSTPPQLELVEALRVLSGPTLKL